MTRPFLRPIRRALDTMLRRRGLQIAFEQFEGTERSVFERALAKRDVRTVFDVGANRGEVALKLARSFPNATIHCFEPVSRTYATLLGETKGHKSIVVHNFALGTEAGVQEIRLRSLSGLNSLVPEMNENVRADEQRETIKVERLDSFCRKNSIETVDFIKTDTEGFDLSVLKGAGDVIKTTRFILSEFALDETDRSHTSLSSLWDYLRPLGFRLDGIYEPAYDKFGVFRYGNALFCKAA